MSSSQSVITQSVSHLCSQSQHGTYVQKNHITIYKTETIKKEEKVSEKIQKRLKEKRMIRRKNIGREHASSVHVYVLFMNV